MNIGSTAAVIARSVATEAIQGSQGAYDPVDCFASLAMTGPNRPQFVSLWIFTPIVDLAATGIRSAPETAPVWSRRWRRLLTLVPAGLERAFRGTTATYCVSDGDKVVLPTHRPEAPVAAEFDPPAVQAAIREAQQRVPGYTHFGFCWKVMAAGCAGTIVSFSGPRVLTYGGAAETHVEHFPSMSMG